jgi:hypothetical protein
MCKAICWVYRNLVLCLLRLAVLVSIEADRPGAWFPDPLGPYAAWFPGIGLSRDFERVIVPRKKNHEESLLCWCLLGGKILALTICARRERNHVKHLLSGLYNLLKGKFYSERPLPGDPRVARCSHFRSKSPPPPLPDFVFFPFAGISARGPQGHIDMALRPNSLFWAPYAAWFLSTGLISEGKTMN